MVKKLFESFTKKGSQQGLELTKKKGGKLYVKQKGYENYFNSQRDKKK